MNIFFQQEIKLSLRLLRIILSLGANVNVCDKNGRNPLFYALMYNDGTKIGRKRLKILLEFGADIKHKDIDGRNSLIFMCHEMAHNFGKYDRNSMHTVVDENLSFLIKNGLDHHEKDNFNKTAYTYLTEYTWHNKSVPIATKMLKTNNLDFELKNLFCSNCKINISTQESKSFQDYEIMCSGCRTKRLLSPFWFHGILSP